ncbi:conserved hypothetical protein [Talaromyces stipitatus ATCC 10500]|uniref:Protein kinase domain-containing protein n=1 Tax=Talaromyces stipitatus (strain ATCC 10500 / CBS 375.48 / QM 6759 / NRRL 1006) TaxID=441959 RepID=B8LZ00_TALSN|nr:uncharacterized protein TSTA_069290 [Talaromyces stipitatus ATCC 10500]EED23508.1 conserved hypothetical protein [Talaromyces stipitatus ATCC 10500]
MGKAMSDIIGLKKPEKKKTTESSNRQQDSSPKERTSRATKRVQVSSEKNQGKSDDAENALQVLKEPESSHEVEDDGQPISKSEMDNNAASNEDSATRIAELEEEIRCLQGQLKSYDEGYRSLQQQLRDAQEGAFRALKKGTWMPKEDYRVRDEFAKLEENIRNWAKAYALSDISTLQAKITETEKNSVLSKLDGYYDGDWDRLVSCTKALVQKRLPRILVQALLAKDIFDNIFDNPFFFFNEETENKEKFRSPFGTQLVALYNEMEKVNEAQAHVWRSDTLRLLNVKTQDARQRISIKRAEAFFQGPVQSLCTDLTDSEKTKCKEELQEVYIWAADLSASLWTQRTYMRNDGLRQLDEFSIESPEMVAHPLYRLDDEDHSMDSKGVVLVVYPLVTAYGNDDGDLYDQKTSPDDLLWKEEDPSTKYILSHKFNQAGAGWIGFENCQGLRTVFVKIVKTTGRQKLQFHKTDQINLVNLQEVFHSKNVTYLIYDFDRCDLPLSMIHASPNVQFTEADIAIVCRLVLTGLQYIHEKLKISHGSIKLLDLVLSQSGQVKIGMVPN